MFYCWDLSTLLSILTTFMAFTKRFLMSSFFPSSCPIVFPRYVNSTVVGRSSLFALISGFSVLFWVRVKTLRCSDVPILPVTNSDKISEKNYHATPGLLPFQLSVVVFVVSSAFEATTLPENSLILSSEPLICGTIYEGVYGATQVKQKAVC